jgi:FtsH-binding integral membrane protein
MVTTISRFFLAFVGVAYIGLGIWCAVAPEKTSKTVGFVLRPGQGQSEFLTVYGGLEVALGLLFLWPLYQKQDIGYSLATCLVVHASLVLFRTLGFFLYKDFDSTTYGLAAAEWVIMLMTAVLYFIKR